jgi:hypothetical protein
MDGDTPQSVLVFDTSHLTLAGSRYFVRRFSDRILSDLKSGP